MSVVLLAVALAALTFYFLRQRKMQIPSFAHDSTPAIDTWVQDQLERELADSVASLGLRGASTDERKGLARSLRGDPDPDIVGKIEDAVKVVEIEYVRFAHESDAEITLRVRYEDGKSFTTNKRIPWADVPEGVRADFDRRGSTHVFRTWPMPWSRVHAL